MSFKLILYAQTLPNDSYTSIDFPSNFLGTLILLTSTTVPSIDKDELKGLQCILTAHPNKYYLDSYVLWIIMEYSPYILSVSTMKQI